MVKEFEGDARSIILKLHHYHTKSNVAQHDIITLTTDITNLTLNDSWKGQSDNSSATSRRNSGCLTVLSLFLINSLRLQESHFSRELCSKTMTSGRSMSWILCGDSRLNPQIPLPLRPITTFFGMQLTSMIFTTPRRDLRERHSYPNMRKSMMKMDISLKKNNLSMTLTKKKNLLHIQFINHHFILRCHRNLTFLQNLGNTF